MNTLRYILHDKMLGCIPLALLAGLLLVGCGSPPQPTSQEASTTSGPTVAPEETDYVITALSAIDTTAGTQGVFAIVPAQVISQVVSLPPDLNDADAVVPLDQAGQLSGASLVLAPRARVEEANVLGAYRPEGGFELSDDSIYVLQSPSGITTTPSLTNTIVGWFPNGANTPFEPFPQAPEFGIEDPCPTCAPGDPWPLCPSLCGFFFCWFCDAAESLTAISLSDPGGCVLTPYDTLTDTQRDKTVLVLIPADDASKSAALPDSLDRNNINPAQAILAISPDAGLAPQPSWLGCLPEDAIAPEDIVGDFTPGGPITTTANSALVFSVEGGASNNAAMVGRIDLAGIRGFEAVTQTGTIHVSDPNMEFPLMK